MDGCIDVCTLLDWDRGGTFALQQAPVQCKGDDSAPQAHLETLKTPKS